MDGQVALPDAFVSRLKQQIGPENLAQYLLAVEEPAPVALRINTSKIATCPFSGATPIPWNPYGYFLDKRPAFVRDPLFHAGAYYVQEPSSMLLYALLDRTRPLKILDLCAAPGGKSTLILQAMAPGSLLVANELIRSRASVLAENLTRWGARDCIVTQNDPHDFRPLKEFFDVIVVDAPCSGEGLFRKDPASRAQWSREGVNTCSLRQRRILSDILPALKPGGSLIYSTCTHSTEENEAIVASLLKNEEACFELDVPEAIRTQFAAWGCEVGPMGIRSYPHIFRGEGFFISRLRKLGEAATETGSRRVKKKEKKGGGRPPKGVEAFADAYLSDSMHPLVKIRGEYLVYEPEGVREIREKAHLHVLKAGTRLGKIRRNEVTPLHDLAMAGDVVKAQRSHSVSLEAALKYLQKQDLTIQEKKEKGWTQVVYEGVSLGWAKLAANRLKNHYPINWRIRKL